MGVRVRMACMLQQKDTELEVCAYGKVAARILGGSRGCLKTGPAKEGPASNGNHYVHPVLRVLSECAGN